MSRVLVEGLKPGTTVEALEQTFKRFATVGKVTAWVASEPALFGFLQYEERRDARAAINAMDGAEVEGAVLRLERWKYSWYDEQLQERQAHRRGREREDYDRDRRRSGGGSSRSRERDDDDYRRGEKGRRGSRGYDR